MCRSKREEYGSANAVPAVSVQDGPSVVLLSDWLAFPDGMAETLRVRLLARALSEAGAQARVLCLQPSERPPDVENSRIKGDYRGVPFEYTSGTTVRPVTFIRRRLVAARGWLVGTWRLLQLRRQGRLDAVYLWFTSQRWTIHRWYFVWLLHRLGVPVLIELNERPWALRGDRRGIERTVSPLQGIDGAVAISHMLAEWAKEEARSLARPIQVVQVPILVDCREQTPAPWPQGDSMVLFAGSPVYDETIEFLLRSMEYVWADVSDCRLAITGVRASDPSGAWLLAKGGRGELDGRVDVVGYLSRAELLELYGRCHALLIPLFDDVRSRARFPTKIGEYLASGRPVVTTDAGEVPRHLTDGETAYVAPAGHIKAYAAAVVRALSDARQAQAVAAAGRALAEQRFDYRLHGGTLRCAFESAVASHRSRWPT